MAFLEKLNAITKNVGDMTNDMIETTKLSARIAKEKGVIEEKKQRLGALCWDKFAAGTACFDADMAAVCGEIQASLDAIAAYEREIASIRRENEKKEEKLPDAAPAELSAGGTFCTGCGGAVPPGAELCPHCTDPLAPAERLCPNCGAELPADAAFCCECGEKA